MEHVLPIWNQPPPHADVVIIGGGLTGVSIAYQLAVRGIGCCLLEKDNLAAGASGRNDGQIITKTADYYPNMKEIYGAEKARGILQFKKEGQRLLDALLAPHAERPPLDYYKVGSLSLAYNEAEAKMIEREVRELRRDGFEMELLEEAEIETLIHTRRFAMGSLDREDASVNPAELTRLIAALARQEGALILENCEVRGVESGAVLHRFGTIRCEIAILATNAYTPRLMPAFKDLIFPTRGQIIATEPLTSGIPPIGCIANFGYDYWHWTPTGRLMMGGRRPEDEHREVGYELALNPKVQKALEHLIGEIYPQYAGAPIAYRWSGTMGFSKDGLPLIGPIGGDPSLWAAAGFTGYGLGMCWAVGLAVAQVLNDEKTFFSELASVFSPNRFY